MKIKQFLTHTKAPGVLTALMFGGVSLTAIHTIPNPPLFPNTNNFVLFADQSLSFEENATISSGDLGTNKTLDIGKDTNITGNLFADKITIDKNISINGNATFNKLKNNGEILGTKTTHVPLPVANLPAIPNFTVGTEDKTIQGTATLPSGNYKNITLQKDSTLTLSGGTYNLNALELQEHSTLIFTTPTTLNIRSKLKGGNNVSVLNGTDVKFNDLHINVRSEQKNDRAMEQDDNETESVSFGKNSFLNFALLAPNASVKIGKDSTLRGRVLARRIRIGKNAIVSRSETFEKESDPVKIVTDSDGVRFFVNEIIVLFTDEATNGDMENIASLAGGKITGIVSVPDIAKIQIPTVSIQELREKIQSIKNMGNPLVIDAGENVIFEQQ